MPSARLAAAAPSAFYRKLNATLDKMGFARRVWDICAPAYAEPSRGRRPGINPVVYLKMPMVGFFENLPSDRAIAARCEDSLSARGFAAACRRSPAGCASRRLSRSVRLWVIRSGKPRPITAASRSSATGWEWRIWRQSMAAAAPSSSSESGRVFMSKIVSTTLPTPADDLLEKVEGRFSTILADPPWQFQNRTGKVAPEHRRLLRYPTMGLQEIMDLPIGHLAAAHSHLYLWVPNALLMDAHSH